MVAAWLLALSAVATAPCKNFALMSLADEDAEVDLLAGALFLGAVIFTCFIEIFGASCAAAYNRHAFRQRL